MISNTLALCVALLLCSLFGMQSEGLPQRQDQQVGNPQVQNANADSGPTVQSIFNTLPICPEGYKVTGEQQRCRKRA